MLFNSIDFLVFFIIIYSIYWRLSHEWQNRLLLAASYIFYGWWDWRFLFLFWFSTGMDYMWGWQIFRSKNDKMRRFFMSMSVVTNLSILGFFKYFNFFISSAESLVRFFHLNPVNLHLNIILPIGVSFYTFQAMSYNIDIYRREIKPCRSLRDFALFLAFFPHLVAGPIMRAVLLIPQVQMERKFVLKEFYTGVYLVFWGLFKKIFIADNASKLVNYAFANWQALSGFELLIGIYAFAVQIYADFSAYSDIARGLGKMMGFDIIINFNLPYFAKNPSDLWRRWHISLSSWLRDYLYISLGGNRYGELITLRNLMLTMLLGGLWHGAAWTFVIWGLYHGMLLVAHRLLKPALDKYLIFKGSTIQTVVNGVCIFVMFNLTCFGWLLFRGENMTQILGIMNRILFSFGEFSPERLNELLFYSVILIAVQFLQYFKGDLLAVTKLHPVIRWAFYFTCLSLIFVFGSYGGQQFIYFQF